MKESATAAGLGPGSRVGHYQLRRLLGRREAVTFSRLALITVVLTVIAECRSEQKSPLVELPFTGLEWPHGVAVDTVGNIYVADWSIGNSRVLKLPAGSNTQEVLPFTGLQGAGGVAVDTAGNVYVTDGLENGRVLKLAAGGTTQVVLPSTSVKVGSGMAVDSAGNIYVMSGSWFIHRVYKLRAG